VRLVDGGADEGVVVVDADLGDVARVVADRDGLADERRQGRREVALALEVDAVALDRAVLGHGQQQPVQFLEGTQPHVWGVTNPDPAPPAPTTGRGRGACRDDPETVVRFTDPATWPQLVQADPVLHRQGESGPEDTVPKVLSRCTARPEGLGLSAPDHQTPAQRAATTGLVARLHHELDGRIGQDHPGW
jgi:hypothetical protein